MRGGGAAEKRSERETGRDEIQTPEMRRQVRLEREREGKKKIKSFLNKGAFNRRVHNIQSVLLGDNPSGGPHPGQEKRGTVRGLNNNINP